MDKENHGEGAVGKNFPLPGILACPAQVVGECLSRQSLRKLLILEIISISYLESIDSMLLG
jgi:hypothetical protein